MFSITCGLKQFRSRPLSRHVSLTPPTTILVPQLPLVSPKFKKPDGAMAHLYRILLDRENKPLTAAEYWEIVKGDERFANKQFMKEKLQSLKLKRILETKAQGPKLPFVYFIRQKHFAPVKTGIQQAEGVSQILMDKSG